MVNVLIPDYLAPNVVASAKSLAEHGDRITFATWIKGSQIEKFRSRHLHCIESLPEKPAENPSEYVNKVVAFVKSLEIDVLIPFGLQAFSAISHSGACASLPTMVASPDIFDLLNSKARATNFVTSLGIDVPKSFPSLRRDDIRDLANHMRFPAVVKVDAGSGVASGLRYANNGAELTNAWDELEKLAEKKRMNASLFVQEFVPGFIHDACTLTVRGQPVQVLTQVRKLMYPIYGGVGAVNVTTDEPELDRAARKILEASGYHGPAQIEFKKDARDGTYKFIEFNPKLWGTLPLSIAAGVSFPALIRDFIVKGEIPSPVSYKAGIRYNFWLPLAALSYVQLIRLYGMKAFRPLAKATRTYHGLDIADPRFLAFMAITTARRLIQGKLVEVNSNIPRELINGPETW